MLEPTPVVSTAPLLSVNTDGASSFNRVLRGPGPSEEYMLEEELGKGAFAYVWRATRVATTEQVAIKIFSQHEALVGDPQGLERAFKQEVRILEAVRDLKCPHVVEMKTSFADRDTGQRCIVLTLAAGGSLESRV
jgi:serine/threonine protein kinase